MPEETGSLTGDLLNELTPAEWRLVVQLVEAIATSDEGECPICHRLVDRSGLAEHMAACRDFSTVRTRRLEVLDGNGRTLAVVGELDRPQDDAAIGVALLDGGTGTERAVLALTPGGPHLEMTAEGNVVAAFGVNDGNGELLAGVCLTLSDFDGAPVARWWVRPDGELAMRPLAGETDGDSGE